MARIAVNALSIANRSGTGRYAWGLVDGIVQRQEDDLHYSILIPAEYSLPSRWWHVEHVRFYSIPLHSPWRRIAWEQCRLPRWLDERRIDLLHATAFIAPVELPRSIQLVVTVHDLAFYRYPETIPWTRRLVYRWLIPQSWKRADAVIADSHAVASELAALTTIHGKIEPIHLGVDSTRYHPRPSATDESVLRKYRLAPGYFLAVGTIEPRKNISTILNAFDVAVRQGFQGLLALVGRYGWGEPPAMESPWLHWLGYVDEADLPALYRNAGALLAPSIYEGFDLPPVEAMACGTPVIASDIPVHRELLTGWAIFVPANVSHAWMEALMNFTPPASPRLQPPMRYSWQSTAEQTIAVYRELRKKSKNKGEI